MSSLPWWHIASIIGGYLLLAIAVLLGAWALFADRSRGRRRCPKCWYDMRSAADDRLICPECGHDAQRMRRLHKTRRRWRWAVVAALLLLGSHFVLLIPDFRTRGWPALVPTTVLVCVAPATTAETSPLTWERKGVHAQRGFILITPQMVGPTVTLAPLRTPKPRGWGTDLSDELWYRLWKPRSWEWQRRWFLRRVLAANNITNAPDAIVPQRWIKGRPIPFDVKWPDLDALQPFYLGLTIAPNPRLVADLHQALPAVHSAGVRQVSTPYTIRFAERSIISGEVSASIEIIDTDREPLLERLSTPEHSSLVREAMSPRLYRDKRGVWRLQAFDQCVPFDYGDEPFGVTAGVEILDGEVVIGRTSWTPYWRSTRRLSASDHRIAWRNGYPQKLDSATPSLTIRVTAEPDLAELSYQTASWRERAACWGGSFEVPLLIVRLSETPRP